jgi:hypothetical protein
VRIHGAPPLARCSAPRDCCRTLRHAASLWPIGGGAGPQTASPLPRKHKAVRRGWYRACTQRSNCNDCPTPTRQIAKTPALPWLHISRKCQSTVAQNTPKSSVSSRARTDMTSSRRSGTEIRPGPSPCHATDACHLSKKLTDFLKLFKIKILRKISTLKSPSQNPDQLFHVPRQRRGKLQPLPRHRMVEPQARRMQGLPREGVPQRRRLSQRRAELPAAPIGPTSPCPA